MVYIVYFFYFILLPLVNKADHNSHKQLCSREIWWVSDKVWWISMR